MASILSFLEPGDTVQLTRAGTTATVVSRLAEGGQGIVYRASIENGNEVALKWIKPSPYLALQRRSITALTTHPRPHPAFAWPIEIVEARGLPGFGYVMAWIDPDRFISLVEMLDAPVQPSFSVLAGLGRELVDAFSKLHADGLCYRDVNFGNLRVDPHNVEVAILDNDNVGTTGGETSVKGTLRFMAPEVIRDLAAPSTESDLHSLAVFLFFLFMKGHPLEGSRVRRSYTWETEDHLSETQLAVENFGVHPLFVFDPSDSSNAPEPGDPMRVWWPIYPLFLRDLFVRAFTVGLTDPSVGSRVSESEWRRALVRLEDCVFTCSCTAAVFWDPEVPESRCWSCGLTPPAPMGLALGTRTIVLPPGKSLVSNDLLRDLDYRKPLAAVDMHPRLPGELVLRNMSDRTWTVFPEGEEEKTVAPGQRLHVRSMRIDFGTASGTLRRLASHPGDDGARHAESI